MLYVYHALFVVFVVLTVRQFEKRNPIEPKQDNSEVIADYKLAALHYTAVEAFTPVIGTCSLALVAWMGGGLIPLRIDGWWFLLSFAVLIIAIDLWSYILHRASHKFPILWAMHSLHHSAEAMSMITGARHFWFELILSFPILGIIFKVPPELIGPIGLVSFLLGDGFVHLNMRMSFGPFTMVLNNPQYHRIHHSVEPQHWNKNFCKVFPIIDVIFGTAWKPGKDEFPRTGLVPSDRATGFVDGLLWPLRHRFRTVPQSIDLETKLR